MKILVLIIFVAGSVYGAGTPGGSEITNNAGNVIYSNSKGSLSTNNLSLPYPMTTVGTGYDISVIKTNRYINSVVPNSGRIWTNNFGEITNLGNMSDDIRIEVETNWWTNWSFPVSLAILTNGQIAVSGSDAISYIRTGLPPNNSFILSVRSVISPSPNIGQLSLRLRISDGAASSGDSWPGDLAWSEYGIVSDVSNKRDVQTNYIINRIELNNPYLVRISVPVGTISNLVTVSRISSITLQFSQNLKKTNTGAVQLLDSEGIAVAGQGIIITNNLIILTNKMLSQSLDIMKEWILKITNQIWGTNGFRVTNIAGGYANPFSGALKSGVDPKIGGIINTNTGGISGVEMVIGPGIIGGVMWIEIVGINPASDIGIQEADSKAERNSLIEPVKVAGGVFEIKGKDNLWNELSSMGGKVEIRFKYKDEDGNGVVDGTQIEERMLNLYYYDESAREWVWVSDAEVDEANNEVKIKTDKFGKYRLMEWMADEEFIVYPNPADYGRGERAMIFYKIMKRARVWIKIYDIVGGEVRELNNGGEQEAGEWRIEWDGKNGRGVLVVSGVYIIRYIAEYADGSERIQEIWKQAVIR